MSEAPRDHPVLCAIGTHKHVYRALRGAPDGLASHARQTTPEAAGHNTGTQKVPCMRQRGSS